MASQLDDETLEGDDKANDLPSEYVVKVNDMEFMRLRTAKSSQIAKLIKMDADLLVISRQDVQGFEARMQDFTGLTYQWEQKVIEAANIANEKGIELKKVTQEMLLLKKQLSSVTQDLAAALVNSKDKSLFPNEEGERLRMRLAEYESLFMTVVTSFEGQDFEEPTSVTQKVVEEREANIQMVENCLQEIEVLERARQKAVRHSLTVQTMFDVIHNQLMKEGDRSQTSRNQARHAWSEAVVLSMTGKPGPVASEPQEPDQEPQELQDLQEQEPEPIQLEQPQEPVVIDGKLHLSPAVESLFLKDQGVYVRRLNDLQNHLAEEMENTDILEEALNEAVEYGEELQMRLAGLQGELQTMIEDKQRLEEESQEQLKHHIQAQQHAASLQELARAEVARRDAQVAALQEALSAQEKQSAARMAQACQEMELMNQTLAAREESDAKARQEIDDLKQMLAAREESDAKALHEKDQQLKAVGEGAAQATEELRTKGQALHEKDQQVEAAHREMEELKQALREKDQQLEAVGEAAHREMEELKQALREKDQQLEAVGETAAQAMDELRTKGQADREVDELKRVLAAREESDAKALQEKHAEEESQEQLKHQMQIEAQQYAASLQELARAEVARRDAQVAALQEALFAQEKQSAASMAQARQEMELMNQALREKDQQLEAVGEAAAQAMDELRTKGQVDQQVEAAHREVDELKRVLAAREESDAKAHREIDELKRMLAARAEGVAQAFQERDQRVQDEPYEGPASFDISTPRSMKSPWADSPEEKRPDDAIVAENRQLHQRLSVAEEEKAIMMQNLRDHIKQLARENWDLKFKAGLIEDSTRSQSAKEAPLQESMNNPGTSSSSGSGSWLLSTILSPFLTDGDMREIHAESYVDQHLGANGQDQLP